MQEAGYTVYGYRWIVLLFYSLIQAVMQMLWITFAPITGDAAKFYGVSALQIGILAMSFMIVYIFISIPASWTIDTYGIRKGVGLGVILTGIFGYMRGFFGDSYTMVLIAMIGIAVAQPFILNSVTALTAKWFPLKERATAAGLLNSSISLSSLMGPLLALLIVQVLPDSSFEGPMYLAFVASLAAFVFFLIAIRRMRVKDEDLSQ